VKVRVRFTKLGKVRWTSHRDVARMWERAFRRVRVPLAYTGGFSPRPKVSFGLALPTGHESQAEYLDFEVEEGALVEVDGLPSGLSPALPTGIDAAAAAAVDERAPSLQEDVTSCTWRINVPVSSSEAARMVERVLQSPSIVVTRERKGQKVTDDIRPAIVGLLVLATAEEGTELEAEVATLTRGLRPAELVAALRPGLELSRACRINQWIERDGARWEPLSLPLDATGAPHAEPVGTGGRAR
jgi:radical SAM-linked protein